MATASRIAKAKTEPSAAAGNPAAARQTEAAIDRATATLKEHADTHHVRVQQAYDDMAAFSRSQFDAAVETGWQVVGGGEAVTRTLCERQRKLIDAAMSVANAMAAAKTPADLVAAHDEYIRTGVDSLVVETVRLVELVNKLARDIAQPTQVRMTAAWDRVGRTA